MAGNLSVAERLDRLAPDQRAAATARPGPVLCLAPAGSGKTTTLVARIAWLIDRGTDPATITAVTFNRRAAGELAGRLAGALEPLGLGPDAVRVRTFHALGLEILRDAGATAAVADRAGLLARLFPDLDDAGLAELDTAISRLKIEHGVSAGDVESDPGAGPVAMRFAAYERALEARGALDFDDLVLGALRVLRSNAELLARWRRRCAALLVDEIQDVDRAQLELGLILVAPANQVFLVGDDDQSIYGWRLADVRRIFSLATRLPGIERHALVANYRCPRPVVERSVRLIEVNRERFAKSVRAGADGRGRLILAPDADTDHVRIGRVLDSWPADVSTQAVIARTNLELVPAAAAALERRIAFNAAGLDLPLEAPGLDAVLAAIESAEVAAPGVPLLVLISRLRAEADERLALACDLLVGWAPRFSSAVALRSAVEASRHVLAGLRTGDALLTLATTHAVKGLEFDHVVVLMDADRFPSRRALDDAREPQRALEEERRLAYVAWTRARRSLTLLYDPAAPSRFLLEAFDRRELG
ncbi:MAG TPA: ATP-dependent helicase [Candidatus Limnocylindrales bacterium]